MIDRVHLNPLPISATFSKDPSFWGVDFHPRAIVHGDGARVLGDDGHIYLDWVSALGANLLGYANREFVLRMQRQMALGAGFSLPHTLEAQVAEKLAYMLGEHVPGWSPENVGIRFGKTGTDATTMAVRLARAATGRQRILSSGYHGWGDWSVSKTPPAWGIESAFQVTDGLVFNDIPILEALLDGTLTIMGRPPNLEIAAVIIEQPMTDPDPGYYAALRRLCDQEGALLIMDEVVTWPRYGLGGACEHFDIEPDIVCLGKGLGNGVAISCIAGRRELFDWFGRDDPVFVSSTHFGEALGLAAADAVLDLFGEEQVTQLWRIGTALMLGLRQSFGYPIDAGINVIGHPPRSLNQFASKAERAYFILGMRDRRILMNRPNLPNLAHTEDNVALTVAAATEVMAEMRLIDVEETMRGRLPRVLFENR